MTFNLQNSITALAVALGLSIVMSLAGVMATDRVDLLWKWTLPSAVALIIIVGFVQ